MSAHATPISPVSEPDRIEAPISHDAPTAAVRARAGNARWDAIARTGAYASPTMASPNDLLLIIATSRGDAGEVHRLLLAGASANARDDTGETPLASAVRNGFLDVARELLGRGASPETHAQGVPILALVAQRGDVALVRALIDAHVHVDAVDRDGQTALDVARAFGHAQIVDMLVTAGAHARVHTLDMRTHSELDAPFAP